MGYIVVMAFFLFWAILVVRRGHLSWHSVVSIYVVAQPVVDLGDELFDYFFDRYDLPTHLLQNRLSDQYLGLYISDAVIFPLIAIVFCYYASRYRHPWLLSLVFATMMGIIEVGLVKSGYIIYHGWAFWVTPALTFVCFRVLAHYSDRLVHYAPPIPYWFWLAGVVYGITEMPAIMGFGVLHFYQYNPQFFYNVIADDRCLELSLGYILGISAGLIAPRVPTRLRFTFFMCLALIMTAIALLFYSLGWLKYHHWNHIYTILRYMVPYLLIYWFDRWETKYLSAKIADAQTGEA